MNLLDLAKRRKTVRKFKKEVPSVEDIKYAISVAKEAPSGKNDQPWFFVLISSEKDKERIREICERGEKEFYEKSKGDLREWLEKMGFTWKKPFLSEAPYLLFVYSYVKSPFSRESVWLSIGYLLLALEEKGLGTVTYTPTNIREVSSYVGLPKEYRLEVILPIGHPDDPKPKYERKDLNNILKIL